MGHARSLKSTLLLTMKLKKPPVPGRKFPYKILKNEFPYKILKNEDSVDFDTNSSLRKDI